MILIKIKYDDHHCFRYTCNILSEQNLSIMKDQKNSITTLKDLLNYKSCKFHNGEVQLMNVLPSWINESSSLKFKIVLRKYLDFIEQHELKLKWFILGERLFDTEIDNRVIKAFIEEAEEMKTNCSDPEVKDACLLACIQEINHYKISSFGTAAAYSKALQMENQAEIFREIEVNEKQIDDRLSQLAEFEINVKAVAPAVLIE